MHARLTAISTLAACLLCAAAASAEEPSAASSAASPASSATAKKAAIRADKKTKASIAKQTGVVTVLPEQEIAGRPAVPHAQIDVTRLTFHIPLTEQRQPLADAIATATEGAPF